VRLRTRLALIAAVAVAVAVVLVSTAAYLGARRELRAEVDASLLERMELVRRAAADVRPALGREFPGRPFLGPPGGRPTFDTLYYQLVPPQGPPLIPPNQDALLPVFPVGPEPELRDVLVDDVHLRLVAARIDPFGIVEIGRPLAETDATLARLRIVLLGVGIVGTVLAGLAGLLVARAALRPIDDLAGAAERVAATQDLEERIAVERADEVGRLAASFNTMLAALDESRDQQRRLVRDAGHELRTPLTALRTNVELLARAEDLDAEARRELLDALEDEVLALSDLVAEVIDLASDRFVQERTVAVRLDEIVEEAVRRWRRRSGRTIETATRPVLVEGRPAALRRAIDNLLDNAVAWGPPDASIEVRVADGEVTVRDHGPGIAPEDASRIFDRFYRAPEARSRTGSGLGLAIVRQIVLEHGGTVSAGVAPGGGAVVGFQLPTLHG